MTASNQPNPRSILPLPLAGEGTRSILPLPLAGEGRGEGRGPNDPKNGLQRRQTTLIHPTHD